LAFVGHLQLKNVNTKIIIWEIEIGQSKVKIRGDKGLGINVRVTIRRPIFRGLKQLE